MDYQTFIIRIVVCFILGCVIGIERQYRHKMVGLRTYVLVCIGSFLFVSVSVKLNNDLTRIASQIVSGIGFLGAGIILRDGGKIRGLNTAATLWCSAAIGVICAFGFLFEATIGTIIILLSNIILRLISKLIMNKFENKMIENYKINLICNSEKELYIRTLLIQKLNSYDLTINNFEGFSIEDNKVKMITNVTTQQDLSKVIEKIINRLSIENGLTKIGWEKIEIDEKEEDNDE